MNYGVQQPDDVTVTVPVVEDPSWTVVVQEDPSVVVEAVGTD